MSVKIIGTTIAAALLALVLAACSAQTPGTGASAPPSTAGQGASAAQMAPASSTVSVALPSRLQKPAGKISAAEITPKISGDIVSIPVSAVQDNWNVHFLVNGTNGQMGFMAYILNDDIQVRASTCPPCRGKTYSLNGNILDCDTCGTLFDATTGIGKSGACVNYPKASAPYNIVEGNITMKISDLQIAYQNTLKPGLP